MRLRPPFALALLGLAALATAARAQDEAAVRNSWRLGAPMPIPVVGSAAALMGGRIYVVGGGSAVRIPIADVQVYDPVADTWAAGVPLPQATGDVATAVVGDVLYVIGGSTSTDGSRVTGAVWAFDPAVGQWVAKAPMPTARTVAYTAVQNGLVYAVGGWNGSFAGGVLNTVESYDPATNQWSAEKPLPTGKMAAAVGLVATRRGGARIVAAGGATGCCPSGFSGDNEGYDTTNDTWAALAPDPVPRAFTCNGVIRTSLYVAGGAASQGPALNTAEAYRYARNSWKALSPMPQAAIAPGSAIYKSQLFCFGGWTAWNGAILGTVQIYQP